MLAAPGLRRADNGGADLAMVRSVNAAVLSTILGLAATAAHARTCTVEVEDLQQIKARALELAMQNVSVDRDKAKAAERQLRRALEGGGPVTIDPKELKGAVRIKGNPSKAAVRDLVARIQKIVESCQI